MPRPAGPPRAPIVAPLALLAWALGAACASERHLVVLSDPPGATVRVDNDVVGVTPLDHPFAHFGGRRLTLYLEGYLPEVRVIEVEAPWFATFPADLFTDLLTPFGYRFVHTERFELRPETAQVSQPELEEVLERAETLRRGGLTGPRPAGPAGAPPPAAPPGGSPP